MWNFPELRKSTEDHKYVTQFYRATAKKVVHVSVFELLYLVVK